MATMIKRPRRVPRPGRPGGHHGKSRAAAGNPMKELRHRYGLSQAVLARLMDVSLRTASAAESGAGVSPQLRRPFTQVRRLCEALAQAMRPAFVGAWLDRPSELLGGLKPVESIERGQLDLVWQVAEGLRSGSQL